MKICALALADVHATAAKPVQSFLRLVGTRSEAKPSSLVQLAAP